jgi:hypothetical protein
MGQAAAEIKERLFLVPIKTILLNGVLHSLAGEGILQLGCEDGKTVQEKTQIQALLVFRAEMKLAYRGEYVGLVEPLKLCVQARDWMKVCHLEPAAIGLDAFAQHLQGSTLLYLIEEAFEKAALGIESADLLELLPFFGLGGIEEVEEVTWD